MNVHVINNCKFYIKDAFLITRLPTLILVLLTYIQVKVKDSLVVNYERKLLSDKNSICFTSNILSKEKCKDELII